MIHKSLNFMHFSTHFFITGLLCLFAFPTYAQLDEGLGEAAAPNVYRPKEAVSGTYIQWSGHYRARGLFQENIFIGSSDYADLYSHRLRLNGSFSPNDDIQAHFSANLYGNLGGNRRGNLGLDQSLVNDSSSDHELQLLKAYGEWDFWRGFFLNFGRQQLDWVNEAMISPNEDDDRPYSFDGLVVHYSDSVVHFQAGVLRLGDWSSQNGDNLDPSEDSYFASIELKGYFNLLKEAQLFFYRTQADSFENADLGLSLQGGSFNRFGVALNGESSSLYYTLDYINFTGTYSDGVAAAGNMGHLKLGGIWGSSNRLRTYVVFHTDTGDDSSTANDNESFDPLYYNHHQYAGLMDLLAWGNLTYYGVGFEFRPDDEQLFLLQFLTFQRTETGSGVSSIDYLGFDQAFITEDINQNTNGFSARDLGFELDFLYKREYSKTAYIELILGAFIPGEYFESYGREKDIYSARLTTGFSF